MIDHHDFSRFRLLDGEVPTYHAAFNMGMEGQITDRRFIYRDVQSGESWPVELATIQAASVRGDHIPLGPPSGYWNWDIRIWLEEPLDPHDGADRSTWDDLTLLPVDVLHAHEVGALLATAIATAYSPR